MFAYRSFLLDSARHMQSVEEIKKLIDALSLLRFNKFHWHLTDDQGWRFECACYPALNGAAVRPYSDFGKTYREGPYGRVYTKEEMREIVAYCAERQIDVVPEFDMPGHTGALLSVFPELSCGGAPVKIKTHQGIFKDVLCPAKEKTLEVVTRILDEFLEVFPGEYIHVGGDETPPDHWKACPDCQRKMKELGVNSFAEYQNWFMNRIVEHLAQRNRRPIVWNDTAKGSNLDKRAVIQYWKEHDKASVRFVNAGGSAILSPFSYCYLDYAYPITPLNRVYALKPTLPGLTAEGRKRILGVEGTLWTEFAEDDETLERLVFPRLIAVSKAALGENGRPYKEFLEETRALAEKMPAYAFADEKDWTHPRAAVLTGWIRYLKTNLTKETRRELLS